MTAWLEAAGLLATLGAFSLGAAIVWWSGTNLTELADAIARKTGLGAGFTGVLLLGIATSLPEVATTASAATRGHATLAGTNLLGGVTMQIAVLALVDGLAAPKRALTSFGGDASFMMQGVLLILLLALVAAAIVIGDMEIVPGLGVWPVLLAATYLLVLRIIYRYDESPRWIPSDAAPDVPVTAGGAGAGEHHEVSRHGTGRLFAGFCAWAVGVFIGGYAVAVSGAVLAEQTGLGESLVGATLVALATSLPELSTTWNAVRIGAAAMAVGNIFGTNALEIALFLPADILYRDGLVIESLDDRATFLAVHGIILTAIYLWGVLERRDRRLLSFGRDSAIVLLAYVVGILLLFGTGNR